MDELKETNKLEIPERSEWHCYLFGGSRCGGVCWNPDKGKAPNAFWRWMQWAFFGNKWFKIPIDDEKQR